MRFKAIFCCCAILFGSGSGQDIRAELNLPELGGASPAATSLTYEHALGQRFLRAVRAQTPHFDDPLVVDYLEHLIFRLSEHSNLKDRRLYITLIKNRMINAFAAPGGVIGINHGLFLHAETQHEFSAILAHELAHLSQRHFARGIEASKQAGVISIAGLLAGAILAATAGSEAGLAAITTSNGLASAQQLSYSRTREAEADRVGIATMIRADLDPRAMAYMFERLDRLNRTSAEQVPEFLRTHPVTKNRISDAYNQTESVTKKKWPPNLDYQLMRARVTVQQSTQNQGLITQLTSQPRAETSAEQAADDYALALAYIQDRRFEASARRLNSLKDRYPNHIAFEVAHIELLAAQGKIKTALASAEKALAISPGNYPLSMLYSSLLISLDRPELASEVLTEMTLRRPNDDQIWYQLAESRGLANDIPGVHQARAEYFVLNGNLDGAITQLGYAIPLVRQNFQLSAKIKQRIDEIWVLQERSDE